MLIFFAICTVLALGVGACTIVIANEAGDAINEFEESGGFEQFEEAIEEATEELEEAAEAMEEEVNADDIGGGQGEPAPPPTGDELGETTCVVSSTNVATVTFDSYVDALADFDFVIELYDADGTALRDGEVSISNVTPLGTSTFPFPLLGVAAATCEVISIEQTS